MKILNTVYFLLLFFSSSVSTVQEVANTRMIAENYAVFNRKADFDNGVAHLNAQSHDGILWLKHSNFQNGVIEADIKGKNAPGQSFVGLAFHGQDNLTFDAVYFRPFNFKNPDRNQFSVQYISMPKNDWSALRNAFPGKYEHEISPVPDDVNDWFHVKVEISSPKIEVYVNHASTPTLSVNKISENKEGKVGLWVGNGSEGWFKNLTLKSSE